ncbi:ACT domain-containing protein [Fusobacterium perfoetens]|uniref:ACT domain-containing protein n=1 Tax=Fusobacterium perfoetens TaxID=852 RepID=UPI000480B70C|nr:ACT domain-containing protein [Fusobacterium perfoetens]MCI6152691.1 ACT domain-containing protein [Fusobacterium perfoetens]MDY3237657.1 ACT domain-containing protein [Fusobacterium perfoetens]
MKSIITVLGKDKVGIIAKVCTYLSEKNINILDISQTIVNGYFNMMMIVDTEKSTTSMENLIDELAEIGKELEVIINMQHEDIFNCMHRI